MQCLIGILIPLFGTALGAALVLFLKNELHPAMEKILLGFAAGIMTAASVWSLLLPAISRAENFGKWAFFPAALGFSAGVGSLLALDRLTEKVFRKMAAGQGTEKELADKRAFMLFFSVTLHNIPEGLAVGVAFAGTGLAGGVSQAMTLTEAMVLALGIAIQNIPEGAVISLPLKYAGQSRKKALLLGTLSGVVEPIAAALTLLLASQIETLLPYCLSFAAGAMILVVVEELIPAAQTGRRKTAGTLGFALGFLLMMILDVALG